MAAKGKGKGNGKGNGFKPVIKDCDYGPEPVIGKRGGRRKMHPNSLRNLRPGKQEHPNSLANLLKGNPAWKGVGGNPSGKAKSVVEVQRLARELSPRAIRRLAIIMDDPKASRRDQIAASVALLDRGCGRPPAVHRFIENPLPDDGAPEDTTGSASSCNAPASQARRSKRSCPRRLSKRKNDARKRIDRRAGPTFPKFRE